jgi:hypothetical protein
VGRERRATSSVLGRPAERTGISGCPRRRSVLLAPIASGCAWTDSQAVGLFAMCSCRTCEHRLAVRHRARIASGVVLSSAASPVVREPLAVLGTDRLRMTARKEQERLQVRTLYSDALMRRRDRSQANEEWGNRNSESGRCSAVSQVWGHA